MRLHRDDIKNIYDAKGTPTLRLLDSRGNEIWSSGGGGDWVLRESEYILGEDGEYYQKWVDISRVVDNNPVPDLNNQWIKDSVSGNLNIDKNFDYFMSNSNYNVPNSYSQFQVKWSGVTSMTFLYRSYAESNYDYLVINGLDKPQFTYLPSYTTSGIIANTRGSQSTSYKTLTVDCDEGEHFIWFCYRKDSSGNINSDRAFVGIPNNVAYYPEGSVRKGSVLRSEWVKDSYLGPDEENPGYGLFRVELTYYTPDGTAIKTGKYEVVTLPLTPVSRNYLRFDATTNDVHVGVNGLTEFISLEYTIDYDDTWGSFPSSGVDVKQGHKLYLRGTGTSGNSNYRTFTTSDIVECHGNVMSLLDKNGFETNKTCGNYCFIGLFSGSKISTAPELPATNLGSGCYASMFSSCANLIEAPELPAQKVAYSGYAYMFQYCTSLTKAPELPATLISGDCYANMFMGCTSLTKAPELPAQNLDSGCYRAMFQHCSNLTEAPEILPAYNLSESCYDAMFYSCSSLTKAPELPATNVTKNCYSAMFANCSSLTEVQDTLPALDLANASDCYRQMFQSCTSLEKGPELPAFVLGEGCYAYMFSSCSNLTEAPDLSAANVMRRFCYDHMFNSCHNLREAPELPATTLDMYCYQFMFSFCNNLVKAPDILPATTLDYQCYRGMFSFCHRLQQAPNLPATVVGEESYNEMFQGCQNLHTIFCMAMYNYDSSEITDNIGSDWLQNAGAVQSSKTFYKNPSWNGPTERNANTILEDWEIEDYPM